MKRSIGLVLMFVLGISVGAAGLTWAQAQKASAIETPQERLTITKDIATGRVLSVTSTGGVPVTLSGDSLGLRIVGSHQGRVVGTIVAKVDGEWREVTFAPQDLPAASQH